MRRLLLLVPLLLLLPACDQGTPSRVVGAPPAVTITQNGNPVRVVTPAPVPGGNPTPQSQLPIPPSP